jgi:phosphoglucomutase
VADIVMEHWRIFGRHFYVRHDYEDMEPDTANSVIEHCRNMLPDLAGKSFDGFTVASADEYSYHDPVDGSISEHQGLRIEFTNGARIVLRASGTGTSGITLRLYLESYQQDPDNINMESIEVLGPVAQAAEHFIGIRKLGGRQAPDVIT